MQPLERFCDFTLSTCAIIALAIDGSKKHSTHPRSVTFLQTYPDGGLLE